MYHPQGLEVKVWLHQSKDHLWGHISNQGTPWLAGEMTRPHLIASLSLLLWWEFTFLSIKMFCTYIHIYSRSEAVMTHLMENCLQHLSVYLILLKATPTECSTNPSSNPNVQQLLLLIGHSNHLNTYTGVWRTQLMTSGLTVQIAVYFYIYINLINL